MPPRKAVLSLDLEAGNIYVENKKRFQFPVRSTELLL